MAARRQQKATSAKKVVVFARAPNSNWARILYGVLKSVDTKAGTATLERTRQCLYYSKETGGEVGLAAIGPQAGSRLSPMAPGELVVFGVGQIAECSASAIAAWESFQ